MVATIDVLNDTDSRIEPHYWVIPINRGGHTIGIIGIDPYTGNYSWRLESLPETYNFPTFHSKVNLQKLTISGYDLNNYLYNDTKFVLINSKNYWMIPSIDGVLDNSLLIPTEKPTELTNVKDVIALIKKERTIQGSINNEDMNRYSLNLSINSNVSKNLSKLFVESERNYLKKESTTASACTRMVHKVPIYDQGSSAWCGPYSLSMIHQWWSPVNLGSGYSQASEIANYLNKGWNDGINTFDAVNVMRNWHDINSNYESWPLSGWVAMNDLQKGEPTWQNSDLKTWIYYDIPVLVSVDANANGAWIYNHWSVVVGYDDAECGNNGGVFVNNPWGFLGFPGHMGVVEYSVFNSKVWVYNLNVFHDNVGIPGFPGDGIFTSGDYVDTSISLQNVPSSIYDDEEASITVKMKVLKDGTASTPSSFGEWVSSGVHIRTAGTDGINGNGKIKVNSLGDFDEWVGYKGRKDLGPAEIVCRSTTSSSGEAKIFEFYTSENGKDETLSVPIKIKPDDIGDLTISYRSWVYDEDDRMHYFSEPDLTVTIYNDDPNGATEMPKPVVYLKGDPNVWMYGRNYLDYVTHRKTITVKDDDTSGPTLEDYADDGNIDDSDITPYVIATKWSDTSGISSVEYRYKFGSGSWSSWESGTQLGSNWHYEIPRSKWINHIGKTLYWEARATDNDNDRPNDKSTSYSGTKTGGLISDDDTTPPSISNMKSEPANPVPDSHNSYIRLKADITDPSGISDVDFKYRYNGGSWKTKIHLDTLETLIGMIFQRVNGKTTLAIKFIGK